MRLLSISSLLMLTLACRGGGNDTADSSPVDSAVDPSQLDGDGDGVPAAQDCDDADADVHPGADERCNGVDDDCDGETDEAATDAATWYGDGDGDGYGAGEGTTACEAPAGSVDQDGDCDDADAAFHPGADESDCADANDYNCDGSTGYADADADGTPACEDCDDSRADVGPGAVEVCDGVDNDCNGDADSDATDRATWYHDVDGDGFGATEEALTACEAPVDYVATPGDCDDASVDFHPGADEPDCADPNDYNCDGSVAYADADGDGFAACTDCDDTTQRCRRWASR